MKRVTSKLTVFFTILMPTTTTFSHEGHGFTGSHWHASDVVSLAALGVLVALAVWLSRK
jgi:hypothetical protein